MEKLTETVESSPGEIGRRELETLLRGIQHPDYGIHGVAGDALEELVGGWSEEEIADQFDAELLSGRLDTESVSGGNALSTVVETLANASPEVVRSLRREIGLGVREYLGERHAMKALCLVLETDTELVTEAEALLTAENSTSRNIAVRLVQRIASGEYEIDEARPEAVEPLLPGVWAIAKNSRETRKPRQNAIRALTTHAEAKPEPYVERVAEITDLLQTTTWSIRDDLIGLLEVIAEHDPDAVAHTVPQVRREFTDITGRKTTKLETTELISVLVEQYPEVGQPIEPFVELIEDETVSRDEAAANIVATVGGVESLHTLFHAEDFTPEHVATMFERASPEDRTTVLDDLEALSKHEDPTIRYRAVSTIVEQLHEEFDHPESVYLPLLDDEEGDRYNTVRSAAAEGIRQIAEIAPERLSDATDRLFAVAQTTIDASDGTIRQLSPALAHLAKANEDVYAQVVDDLTADEAAQYVATRVFSDVATAYPSTLENPVPTLLEIYGDEDRELGIDATIQVILGGLVYARPQQVEPVLDRATQWFQEPDGANYASRQLLADLASEYPEVGVEVIEELAEDLADGFSGDYPADHEANSLVLSHAAREEPERVRDAITPLLERAPENRPPSLALIRLSLGDTDPDEVDLVGEDDWFTNWIRDSTSERDQLRTVSLLGAIDDGHVRPLLEQISDEAASERVANTASEALNGLS